MTWLALAVIAASTGVARADDTPAPTAKTEAEISSIAERFAKEAPETPDFRMHVSPLLGKVGCNGRACHGSFQGRGNFRLSLFGFDFKMDHDNLTKGDNPRVDLESPEESLILQKATLAIPHKGGERFAKDSWQYRVLLKWAQTGADGLSADREQDAVKLQITPSELHFSKTGEQATLKVVAHWQSGRVEDVTALCRFQSNNEQVATLSESLITSAEPGSTHIVVSYDNAVVPVLVVRPVSDKLGDKYPMVATPTRIDELVVNRLKQLGIVPSDVAGDAEFLRRVSLDLAGTLPAPTEVEAFLSDTSSDKRQRKVNELLERPSYAAWWTTKLCDITGNNDQQLNNVGYNRSTQQWYDWIQHRVVENMPYDKLVEGIVLAKSREEGESYADYCKEMSEFMHKGTDTNFSERDGLTYYWARRNYRSANERALGFAYTFLGIRIQCAECHKHPFDQWTQDDYKQFSGFFDPSRIRYGQFPAAKKEADEMLGALGIEPKKSNGGDVRRALQKAVTDGKIIPTEELFVTAAQPERPANKNAKNKGKKPDLRAASAKTAKLLGGEVVKVSALADPRTALMDWLRQKDNPYFARAFVNRVWANYFNVGIVNPTDDMSLANPPSNAPLLDYLAAGFVEHNYDMKWLHREICNSRTYQLSWVPNETNKLDETNFSRAVPRRLPAEIAYDAIYQATCTDEEIASRQTDVSRRAISVAGTQNRGKQGTSGYALTVFGRSVRESNCDCDRSAEASLLQTIYLQNDDEVLRNIERRGGWIDQMAKAAGMTLTGEPDAKQSALAKQKAMAKQEETNKQAAALMQKGKGDVSKLDKATVERQIVVFEKQLAKATEDKNEKRVNRLTTVLESLRTRQSQLAQATDKPAAELAVTEAPKAEAQPEVKPEAPKFDSAKVVRLAYLRTLSRPPTDTEVERSTRFIHEAADPVAGLKGLLWALVNTKEFIINH